MPLSEKEKKELEILGNPDVTYMSPAVGALAFSVFGGDTLAKRKERYVELKTKLRMEDAGLDPKINFNQYYKIKNEVEDSFDRIFKIDKK